MNNQLKPSAFVGYTNFDLTINLDNNEENSLGIELAETFWHFLDLLWIYLFLFVSFYS